MLQRTFTKPADLYALACAKFEAAAAEKEAARLDVIAAAAGRPRLDGDAYAVELSTFPVDRLSTTTAREFLTAAQVRKCTSTSTSTRLTVKAAAGADKTAAALVNGLAAGIIAEQTAARPARRARAN